MGGADGKGGGAWVTVMKMKGETPQIKGRPAERRGGWESGPQLGAPPPDPTGSGGGVNDSREDSGQGAESESGLVRFQGDAWTGRVRKGPSPSSSPPPRLPGYNLTSSGAEQPWTPGGKLAPAAANHSQALSQQQDL